MKPSGGRNVAWNRRLFHLLKRARVAVREGGFSLFARRLKRWAELRWGRVFPSRSYQRWIAAHAPTVEELQAQRKWAESQSPRMLFSVLCPVYQTPLSILAETVKSVQNQSYPFWELCLAVSDEEPAELRAWVARVAGEDERIKRAAIPKNQGISESTNAALNVAQGAFVAFLDHDDLLAPQALYSIARHLAEQPDCDVIYSDEDLLSANGRFRKSPMLKPDWSPEMLWHFNYVCHLAVIRRALVRAVGGLRAERDGAQDWDLLLRVTERTGRVHHLPEILYHWRESPTSTAGHLDAKPYVIAAQQAVLRDGFQRRGLRANVEATRFGHYRPRWLVAGDPLVSVIIPSRNQLALLRPLIAGLFERTGYQHLEIVIVDNDSSDPEVLSYYQELNMTGRVRIVPNPGPFNYSAACNRGARAAAGEYFLFLNNDVEVLHRDWLDELLGWGQQPGVGLVGAKLLYPDGRTQHAGLVLGLHGLAGHVFHQTPPETPSPFGTADWGRNVSAVTGACQLIRRDLFWDIGGFDEEYTLLYSDLALCLEVRRRGRRVVYAPHCRLIHHECSTRPSRERPADARRFAAFLRQMGFTGDPYFHPALSAHAAVPQLRTATALNVSENLKREVERHLAFPGSIGSEPNVPRRAA